MKAAGIGFSAIAFLFLLAACNDRLVFTGGAHPVGRAPFLGPIPSDFLNSESRDGFQQLSRGEGEHMTDALSLFAEAAPLTSRTTLVADGLPEIGTCGQLGQLYGGFLTRAALTAKPSQAPAELVGLSCQEALTAIGSALPMIGAALQGQTLSIVDPPALRSDDCTQAVESRRLSRRAAWGVNLTRTAVPEFYLAQYEVPRFHADFEGGAAGERFAQRGNVELEARAADSRLYHGAGIATFGDSAAHQLAVSRVEELSHVRGQSTKAVWLSTDVTLDYGAAPRFSEETDWTFYTDRAESATQRVTVTASGNAAGGTDVDVSYGGSDGEIVARWTFGIVDGTCVVSPRD